MKEIFKNGGSLFLRIVIAIIMSAIVTVSISVICTAAFTKEQGYKAFVYNEKNEQIDEYMFSYDDGDDTKLAEYESKGYTVSKSVYRSELEGKGFFINEFVSQAISLIMLFVFIYNQLFTLGNKDLNLVRTGHKKEDKLKGLKIGLVSAIPSFILYGIMLVCGLGVNKNMTAGIFSLPNFHIYQILRWILNGTVKSGDLNVLQYVLMFLCIFIVPAISCLSYVLGYKDIFVIEKIIYKNKKKKQR